MSESNIPKLDWWFDSERIHVQTTNALIDENNALKAEITDLKHQLETLTQRVETLWCAPPGGGPGYNSAKNSFDNLNPNLAKK